MEEIDENSLEWGRKFKKYLRFEVGTTVYLLSDLKRKCPITINEIILDMKDCDYQCCWVTSQRDIKYDGLKDKVLCV